MRKKALSLLLTLAMLCSLLVVTASATEADNPTEISSLSDITNLAGNYKLTADVTINAATWTPVGTSAPFTGTFDGAGHTITWTGTATLSANNFAIFATNGGTIENLNVSGTLDLANGGSTSRDYVAAVVGTNSGTINKVTSSTTVNASNTYNVGGIAGYNTGYILNSANSGAVNGYARVGGIVGDNEGTVNSCSNTAQVKMFYSGKGGVGGIAGFNGDKNGANTAHIWNCYNTGYIVSGTPGESSTQGSWVGGICGFVNVKSDCVNCYNTGNVSGYQYLDHISGRTEGVNTNCYGLKTASGPEGYDSAAELTENQMKGLDPVVEGETEDDNVYFLTALSAGAADLWTQASNSYPTLTNAATTTSGNPTENVVTYSVIVYSNPTKLTYTVNETLSLAGLEIRAVYTNGTYVTITNYTSSIAEGATLTESTTLTISGTYENVPYSFTFDITVNPSATTEIYLDVVNGSDNNDGTSASAAVKTYDKAVELAGDGGIVAVNNTVTLSGSGTVSYFDNVTFKRADGFTGALFKVTSGTIRLAGSAMVLDGGVTTTSENGETAIVPTGTLVEVTGGTLVLRGGVKLQNCATAVDVQAGGAVTVNKATISASQYSVKLAGSTSTFTLEDFGGTSISGNVYLGTGAKITLNTSLADWENNLIVTSVETGSNTVIAACSSTTIATESAAKITVNGNAARASRTNIVI